MRDAVPDWEVSEVAFQVIRLEITLPDPDDAHVFTTAIAGHADCIVTLNLKDFPGIRIIVLPGGVPSTGKGSIFQSVR